MIHVKVEFIIIAKHVTCAGLVQVFSIRAAATDNLAKLAQEFGADWAQEHLVPQVRMSAFTFSGGELHPHPQISLPDSRSNFTMVLFLASVKSYLSGLQLTSKASQHVIVGVCQHGKTLICIWGGCRS